MMSKHDFTSIALYLCFGMVLSATGHDIGDITYWLLFALFMATDIHSSSTAYRRGLEEGGTIVKKIWGIK
jgi:hypothetical protein